MWDADAETTQSRSCREAAGVQVAGTDCGPVTTAGEEQDWEAGSGSKRSRSLAANWEAYS